MIFVSVGTFIYGFDALIEVMDRICQDIAIPCFAQIGNSKILPRQMDYARFLSAQEMNCKMAAASLVVCHGGFGVLGDAMRAQKMIITVPRQVSTTAFRTPANNQLDLVMRLSERYGIRVCRDISTLPQLVTEAVTMDQSQIQYALENDIPELIVGYLKSVV